MKEKYPGQAYYWKHNPNIRNAEIKMLIQKGFTAIEKAAIWLLFLLCIFVMLYFNARSVT